MAMDTHICLICGHVYDPSVGESDLGVPAGIEFKDLPHDWHCPICQATPDKFQKR
jgi:rubredoxin